MDILYIGHSSFLITSETNGTRILVDPYDPKAFPDDLKYLPYCGEADILLSSHKHGDHFTTDYVIGNPKVIDKPGEYIINGIKIKGVETDHDEAGGSKRGKNIVFVLEIDGLTIAHMGDLGSLLTPQQIEEIGKIDIILIPVGGYFTIDADTAHKVAKSLEAKVIIPMHYATNKCTFPIAPVEDFINKKLNVVRLGVSEFRPTEKPKNEIVLVLEAKG